MGSSKKELLIRFLKFCLVGLLNTGLHLSFFQILFKFGIHYILCQSISFVLVNSITFSINKFWTFKNKDHTVPKQISLYYLGRLFTLSVTLSMTIFLVEFFGIHPFTCQLLAVFINVVLNFLFAQIFIFVSQVKPLDYYLSLSSHQLIHIQSPKKRNVVFLVPLFKEHHRLYPKTEKNPNGEDFLNVKIKQLHELFDKAKNFQWKLIFIDDGDLQFHSSERVLEQLKSQFQSYLKTKKIEVWFLDKLAPQIAKQSRKGGSILYAMKALDQLKLHQEDIIFYTDADISSDLRMSGSLISALENDMDIAITSRWHNESSVLNRGIKEKIGSWTYNLFVYFILRLDFTDTQNGFKAFKYHTIKQIIPYAQDISFAFDTELLMLAQVFNKKMIELPIYWKDSSAETNIHLMKDSIHMLLALLKQKKLKKKLLAISHTTDPTYHFKVKPVNELIN